MVVMKFFSNNALEGYYISMLMKDQGAVKARNDRKMFCIYKKIDGLLEDVINMKPLRIVIFMDNDELCLYCVTGRKRYIDNTLKYIGHRTVIEESELRHRAKYVFA